MALMTHTKGRSRLAFRLASLGSSYLGYKIFSDRQLRVCSCYHLNVAPMAGPLNAMSLMGLSDGRS